MTDSCHAVTESTESVTSCGKCVLVYAFTFSICNVIGTLYCYRCEITLFRLSSAAGRSWISDMSRERKHRVAGLVEGRGIFSPQKHLPDD